MTDRRAITEPEITGNARLALGFIMGRIMDGSARPADAALSYRPSDIDAAENALEIEHRITGNRFRVTVVQIAGAE